MKQVRIFIPFEESQETATSADLKGDKSMHLLCEFHVHAYVYFPWQVI